MSDLPSHGLFQQSHARPKTGEELEVLGKTASSKWLDGRAKTLNDAVVETVKHAGLAPEHVKRVCEFANTDAFLKEFKKESGVGHHVVDFQGGPADPSEVLKDLNDGGGGSVYDPGTSDYHMPPSEKRASASLREEAVLAQTFGFDYGIPLEDPLSDVTDLRDKLAGAYEHLSSQLSGLEIMYEDTAEILYQTVKQAALHGSSLGEIAQVLEVGAPDAKFLKIAFEQMTPRLLKEGVYRDINAALTSMDKTASRVVVNQRHPLVTAISEFAQCLDKLAHTRLAAQEVNVAQAQATAFLKSADAGGGWLVRGGKLVRDTAAKAAPHAGSAAGHAARALFGEGAGAVASKAVEKGVQYSPHALAAAAALLAARRVSNDPTANAVYHGVQAHANPLSNDWDQETYRQQVGGQVPQQFY